jgi:phosphatidylglycerol lysyltransferase
MKSTDSDRERVLNLLRHYGYQSQSYNILSNDKSYFFSSHGIDGVIAYVARARVALAAGDPVCDPSVLHEFIAEFREFCRMRGWRCCFQAVTDRCERVLSGLGFGTLKIGEEPIFDLSRLSCAGSKFRDLRHDINSAKKHGLSVMEYRLLEERRPDWEEQMEELSRNWVKFKGSYEFSFLIGEPSLNEPGDRKYFLALKEEQVEAFIVCTPIYARNGIYFDLMRRKQEPISGTAQILIIETLRLLKEQGYEMATLGAAPLAHEHVEDPDQSRIIELGMDFAFNYMGYFYHFKPLYQFKEQFGPTSWEGRYLAFWPSRFNPVILYALLKAYDPSGVSGQLLRQLQMAWRGIKWLGQVPQDVFEKVIVH